MTMGHQNRKITFSSGLKNKTKYFRIQQLLIFRKNKLSLYESHSKTEKHAVLFISKVKNAKLVGHETKDFETIPKINPPNLIKFLDYHMRIDYTNNSK